MKPVTIYTSDYCGFCRAAKHLLEQQEVPFSEIDVSDDFDKRQWLAQITGQRTVPQIFIDEKPIGGYSELSDLIKNNEFRKLIE